MAASIATEGTPAPSAGVALRHEHLAPELAHDVAALVRPDRVDRDHAAVRLRARRRHVDHRRLGVDRVAVERRLRVLQLLHLEVRDRLAGDVRHAHSQDERVHQVADDDVLAELGLGLGVVGVGVQRVVVHRDHAEQVVVGLGDGLAGPVLVDVADLEVLEVAAETGLAGIELAAAHSGYLASMPRATISFWISLVPSPTSSNRSSRYSRSISYSLE